MSHPATSTPSRATTEDRRTAIAAAARALIVEKGVEGLRTRDIADRVGINVATLHYHVPTKEALIELVGDSLRREFMEQHVTRPRSHLSARERMDLEFVDFREMLEERPEVIRVYSELMERARRDERIAACIRPMQRKWRDLTAALLTQGVSDGAYRPDLDPEAAALMIIGALISYCRSGMSDWMPYERLVAELQRAIRNPNSPSEDNSHG
jgi:AcrR family transcriptional regulator